LKTSLVHAQFVVERYATLDRQDFNVSMIRSATRSSEGFLLVSAHPGHRANALDQHGAQTASRAALPPSLARAPWYAGEHRAQIERR
jgi:hypothetical protein